MFLGFEGRDKCFFQTLHCIAVNGLRKEAKLHRKIYDLFMENIFSFASKLYPVSVCSVLMYDFCLREASSYGG